MIDDKLLDLSNYDQGTFNAECLRASGVQRVILGTTSRSITEWQIIACRDAGIEVVGLYGFVYYGGVRYVTRDVDNAIWLRERYGIPYFAIDCETDAWRVPSFAQFDFPKPNVGQRQSETMRVRGIAERAGFKCLIYTGWSWWETQMGNTKAHADLPLWLANYGTNDPANPRPAIETVDFGGWTAPSIHQYSSSIPVCGRGRDHNYYLRPLEVDDEMSAEDRKRLDRLEGLIGGNGIIDTEGNEVKGEEALVYLAKLGWSARKAVDNLNAALKRLEASGNIPGNRLLSVDTFERALHAAIEEARTIDTSEEATTL